MNIFKTIYIERFNNRYGKTECRCKVGDHVIISTVEVAMIRSLMTAFLQENCIDFDIKEVKKIKPEVVKDLPKVLFNSFQKMGVVVPINNIDTWLTGFDRTLITTHGLQTKWYEQRVAKRKVTSTTKVKKPKVIKPEIVNVPCVVDQVVISQSNVEEALEAFKEFSSKFGEDSTIKKVREKEITTSKKLISLEGFLQSTLESTIRHMNEYVHNLENQLAEAKQFQERHIRERKQMLEVFRAFK